MMSGASILQDRLEDHPQARLAGGRPASFLILFVRSLESFEVPALLGLPVGIHVYHVVDLSRRSIQYPSQIGLAAAYAITLLLITSMGGIYLQSQLDLSGCANISTVTGKGYRPRTSSILATGVISPLAPLHHLLRCLVVLMPFLVLVWSSLQKFYSAPSVGGAQERLSLDSYRDGSRLSAASGTTVRNSACHPVDHAPPPPSCCSRRSRSPGWWYAPRSRAAGSSTISRRCRWCFPGLVHRPVDHDLLPLPSTSAMYGTIWIMLIAYVTRFMPYGMRYVTTSMLQIHKELEESAAMSGRLLGASRLSAASCCRC